MTVLTGCGGEGSAFEAIEPTPTITAPPPPPPKAVIGDQLAPLDVASLPGAYSQRITTAGDRPASANWSYLDGATALNNYLDGWLFRELDAWVSHDGTVPARFEPTLPQKVDPAVTVGELALRSDVVQAAGQYYGVRITTTRSAIALGGETTSSETTIYFDTTSGSLTGADALIDPAQFGTLQKIIADAITAGQTTSRAKTTSTPTPVPTLTPGATPAPEPQLPLLALTPAQVLADAVFSTDGDLVVSFAAGEAARPEDGPRTVRIRSKAVAPLLSEFGRSLHNQVVAQAPFAAPAAAALGSRHVNCDLVPCVALTYDDGPRSDTTAQLLDILRDEGAFATFFGTGASTTSAPGTAAAAQQAGHLVENHTWNHPNLTKLDAAGIKSQIDRTQTAITNATGVAPVMMRPPYGAFNPTVKASVGLPMIYWSVDSLDWQNRDPATFVPFVLNTVAPGGVVLMHDIHPTTISGQKELISGLKNAGYNLVTVGKLFEGIPLAPGEVYFCRGVGPKCTPGR